MICIRGPAALLPTQQFWFTPLAADDAFGGLGVIGQPEGYR